VWEEETVSECASMLHNVVLHDQALDRWRWLLDPIHAYSVKGTYNYLTMLGVHSERGRFDDVWMNQVPLNVYLCVPTSPQSNPNQRQPFPSTHHSSR